MLTLSSICSHLVNEYVLVPLGVEYLRTIAFILGDRRGCAVHRDGDAQTSPLLYQVLGIFLPLITTNCAVLGVALLNIQEQHGFVESALYGFGAAVGFSLVLVLFAAVRERVAVADVPEPFQGNAIALVTAGLMSMARASPAWSAVEPARMITAILTIAGLATLFGLILGYSAIRFRVGATIADQIDAPAADPVRPVRLCRLPSLRRGDGDR